MCKPFLTYDQQIDKLIKKGLTIKDKDHAIELLKNNSYFSLISGYKKPFKKSDGNYKNGACIDDIYALYIFDENLRHLLLENILIVERRVKSLYSYAFCSVNGNKQEEYLDVSKYDYTGEKKIGIDKLVKILQDKLNEPQKYQYIKHQMDKYGNVPLWVIIKAVTFGNVSKMFSFSQNNIKTMISKEIQGVSEGELERMIDLLSRIRNVCAHDERLYDYRVRQANELKDSAMHDKLGIKKKKGHYIAGKKDMFAVMIVLKYLLYPDNFKSMCNELESLIKALNEKTSFIPKEMLLKSMGFPHNWKDIITAEA